MVKAILLLILLFLGGVLNLMEMWQQSKLMKINERMGEEISRWEKVELFMRCFISAGCFVMFIVLAHYLNFELWKLWNN